jgi:hypothetical protein
MIQRAYYGISPNADPATPLIKNKIAIIGTNVRFVISGQTRRNMIKAKRKTAKCGGLIDFGIGNKLALPCKRSGRAMATIRPATNEESNNERWGSSDHLVTIILSRDYGRK